MGVTKLSLLERAPYIEGRKSFPSEEAVVRMYDVHGKAFMQMLEEDSVAMEIFKRCQHYKDFFAAAPDFCQEIPKQYWEEVFYLAKNNGKYFVEIPSLCRYVLSKAWEASHGIPNMIVKMISHAHLELFCSEGYLMGGLSLKDAIHNVCTPDYVPLSEDAPNHAGRTFGEIYVQQTDMVLAVPLDIYEIIGKNGVVNLEVTSGDILFGGRPVRTLASYAGAAHSLYDLRDIL